MIHTAGTWDATDNNLFFLASNVGTLTQGRKCHSHLLCAVNEILNEPDIQLLETWMDAGSVLFIDSGVFWLTNEHARAHGMTMNQVLEMPPSAIDGFDALFERYCKIIRRIGDRAWGYIEIDQGGRENKKITRARLEHLGFRPIPVYHPLSDGWDYFDELAEQYDRICFGNVVHADKQTKKRLMATAWERRRKYPHLWIHFLGLSVNQIANAYPVDSCDSSGWLSLVRWATSFRARTACQSVGPVGNLTYVFTAHPDSETGHQKVRQLGAYNARFDQMNWRGLLEEYRKELLVDPNGRPVPRL